MIAGGMPRIVWGQRFHGEQQQTNHPYSDDLVLHAIPSSGEVLPAIGLGTYITFNVGPSQKLRQDRKQLLQVFFDEGGGLVDSSPMYGTSESVLGYALERVQTHNRLFSATKVWTHSTSEGLEQVNDSLRLWGRSVIDLEQVHNLVNWKAHLNTLRDLKAKGKIRYIGVTTSHGRRHDELERILRSTPLDFVQLTFNAASRGTMERLIPLARDKGIAVIANRPYAGGQLIKTLKKKTLPEWAQEVGIHNAADFLLKYIIAQPGITCAIPATSNVSHLKENMRAMRGRLPDIQERKRMLDYLEREIF